MPIAIEGLLSVGVEEVGHVIKIEADLQWRSYTGMSPWLKLIKRVIMLRCSGDPEK